MNIRIISLKQHRTGVIEVFQIICKMSEETKMIKSKLLEKLPVSKPDNLVSSSMMLVNNPGSGTIDSYFPDPRLSSYTPSSSAASEDYYHGGQQHIPWLYNYCYQYRSAHSHSGPKCSCEKVPLQETFLHQILTGKGYKNDQLFMTRHIKQEMDYHDYGCCYGYQYSYGYPVYQ